MTFPSIRIEGAILSGDLLAKLDKGDFVGQRPADFGFDSQPKLKEEIVRAWTAAQAFYTAFQHKFEGLKETVTGTSETRNQWIIPFLGLLSYSDLDPEPQTELVGDKPFRFARRLRSHGGFPVHIVSARESLDKKPTTGPRVSPHAHLQEYLNLTEHLYGIVTNGKLLRLLRDSTRLIKLSYVEFDLDRMFGEELFADFAVLYRLLHVTRLPRSPEKSSESLLERYHQDALESGARIRDGLSFAVEQVVQELGSGFLARNENLRTAVADNSVTARELHHALLRLIYRLLLMMVAEERGLLFTDAATPRQRKLYLDHYSINRLRRLAERRALADSTKHDLWRGLRSTFRLFETDGPGAPLGLTGLGGQLFSAAALGPLQAAELDNGTLLSAFAKLSLFHQPDTKQLSRVNYGALATEEFGSVYERLLELHPVINPATGHLPPTFTFKQAAGNERKTTGSYYTPSSLVECLLDSALDPVLDDRLKNFAKLGYKSADEAVLALKVSDPACGSGHFLIAAAQRIARRLALLRSKGDEPSVSELRHTLREVIGHCIYGVDINPMSVELCKVGLWLEAMEAGKPLSFLDHHIRCGNSLLGATPALIAEGIPDDAFTAIEGDDKKACTVLKKLNAREKLGFGELFAIEDSTAFERLQQAAVVVENLPDDSVRAVEQKSFAFEQLQHNYDFEKATDLANLWCAAFVIRKRMADGELANLPAAPSAASDVKPAATQAGLFGETFQQPAGKTNIAAKATAQPSGLAEAIGITSGHLRNFAKTAALPDGLMKEVQQLAGQYRFFHWHLAFPEVFRPAKIGGPAENTLYGWSGGFDVLLGNPPWEVIKVEKEDRDEAEKIREIMAVQMFTKNSGLFPLGSHGKTNTMPLFTELFFRLLERNGKAGLIVKTVIATERDYRSLFTHIVAQGILDHLVDIENSLPYFPDVHRQERFSLVNLNGSPSQATPRFAICLRHLDELRESSRIVSLTESELCSLGGGACALPSAGSVNELRILGSISGNPSRGSLFDDKWGVKFFKMLDTTQVGNDPATIRFGDPATNELQESIVTAKNVEFAPVYEGKLFDAFDHRYATFTGQANGDVELSHTSALEKSSAEFRVLPRYWISKATVVEKLAKYNWDKRWVVVYGRKVNRSNVRTMSSTVLPISGAVDTCPTLLLPGRNCMERACALVALMNTFAFDYLARQKLSGFTIGQNHLSLFTVPALSSVTGDHSAQLGDVQKFILHRVLELTYTAWDLEAFAQDCGWSGPPFRWDEERRFQLRCELDAAFFHLYGLNRDDTAYILDTFPIVKRKDEEKHGHYRTKDRILEIYDALAESQRTSRAYISQLNPAPATIRAAHPPRYDRPRTNVDVGNYILGFVGSLLRHLGGECDLMKLVRAYALLLPERKQFAELTATQFGADARGWVERFTQPVDAAWFLPILRGMDNREIIDLKEAADDVRVVLKDKAGPPSNPTLETDVFLVMSVLDLAPDKQIAEPVKRIAPKAPRVLIKELEPMFV
jgi:hypothetical protein